MGARVYNFGTSGFGVEEAPGISVFYRDEEGCIFHPIPCFARGLDMINAAYHYLDLTPLGPAATNRACPTRRTGCGCEEFAVCACGGHSGVLSHPSHGRRRGGITGAELSRTGSLISISERTARSILDQRHPIGVRVLVA